LGTIDTYNVRIKGTRPLFHHRFPAEEESGKRTTTHDAKEEAASGLYKNKDGVPIQPSVHLEGAMINAAKMFKWKGRKTYMDVFESSVFVLPLEIPFAYPEDPLGYVVDERPVRIPPKTGARVLGRRPRWDEWEFEFQIQVLQPDNLTGTQLKDILEYAGSFKGIGDYRPKFGTFVVTKFEKVVS